MTDATLVTVQGDNFVLAAHRLGRLLTVLFAFALIASACTGGSSPAATDGGTDTDAGGGDNTSETAAPEDGADETADGSDTVTAEDDTVEILEGGTLRIGLQTEAGSLNPTNTPLNRGPIMLATAIFDTLVVVDAEGQWHNNMTESWTPNEDFTSWEVKVREGIVFSDGEPFNAEAVVTTVDAMLKNGLLSLVFKPTFDEDAPIELVDEMTFRLNANGPNTQMPLLFSEQMGMIGSPKWLEAAAANPDLDQAPIGAGPFVLADRSQDTSTLLNRNENWWRDVDVNLDAIEFFPVPQPGTRADQLLVGDLDLIHGTAGLMILPLREEGDAVQRIEDNSGEEFFFVMNAQSPPFDDIRVRKAATHLFPTEDYAEFINQGTALMADSLFSPDSRWHDPSIKQETDMPDEAAPLIAEYCAEVPDQCTDGKVNIEYQYDVNLSNDQIYDLVSDAMSSQFNITVETLPNDIHIQQVTLGLFQFASWRYHGFSDPDIDTTFLTCSTIKALSVNFARNCNEEREQLIAAQRATEDFDERYAIWQDLQANLRDSYQYVLATHTNWTVAAGLNVGGMCDSKSPDGAELPCQSRGVPRLDQIFFTG